jgi:hypothetical protein
MKYSLLILSFLSVINAYGQGWYNSVPPVKVPTSTVQKARPVDVAGAWDKADKDGAERGYQIITKLQDMKKRSLVYDFSNSKAVRYVALVDKKYNSFISELIEKMKSDAAYFNGYGVESGLIAKGQRLLTPPFLMRAADEYQYYLKAEEKLTKEGTINQTAFIDNQPLDQTYKELFQLYKFEESEVFELIFAKKSPSGSILRDADGYPIF